MMAAAVDAGFRTFGSPAIYADGGTIPRADPVQVILRAGAGPQDIYGRDIVTVTTVIDIRRSEVEQPCSGDTVTLGGVVYAVQGAPRLDDLRLVWTCDTDGGYQDEQQADGGSAG